MRILNWELQMEIHEIMMKSPKLIFQIPNLHRKDLDNLPSGSYRNRGYHSRSLKIRK